MCWGVADLDAPVIKFRACSSSFSLKSMLPPRDSIRSAVLAATEMLSDKVLGFSSDRSNGTGCSFVGSIFIMAHRENGDAEI